VYVFYGAIAGLLPGAIACIAYSSFYLAVQGELAVLAYETYFLPALAFIGAALGVLVGSVVGWRGHWLLSRPPQQSWNAVAWRLAATGAVSGVVSVSGIAAILWGLSEGRGDASYLLKVNLAGAIVGVVTAPSVGWVLLRTGENGGAA
jgi:hypothetical protein